MGKYPYILSCPCPQNSTYFPTFTRLRLPFYPQLLPTAVQEGVGSRTGCHNLQLLEGISSGVRERAADSCIRFLYTQETHGPSSTGATQRILIWRQNRQASWAASYYFTPLIKQTMNIQGHQSLKNLEQERMERENKAQLRKTGECRTTLEARQETKRARE